MRFRPWHDAQTCLYTCRRGRGARDGRKEEWEGMRERVGEHTEGDFGTCSWAHTIARSCLVCLFVACGKTTTELSPVRKSHATQLFGPAVQVRRIGRRLLGRLPAPLLLSCPHRSARRASGVIVTMSSRGTLMLPIGVSPCKIELSLWWNRMIRVSKEMCTVPFNFRES